MSWINDRINYCKGQRHIAAKPAVTSACYSNEQHLADLRRDETALATSQAIECDKLIKELWLSQCEDSLQEQKPIYLTPKQQGDKLLQATKIKALRRTWQKTAA